MIAILDPVQRISFLRYWGFLGLFTVLLLTLITPPFQVPDEPQHFFRAYQISEGKLIAEVRGATAGGVLPSSLQELTQHFLGGWPLHSTRPIPLKETLTQLTRPLEEGAREFTVFTGAAAYGPLAYAPQIIAIKVASLFNASVLTTFYLARIVNGLCALALLGCALRLMPWGRELAAFSALLPMATYLYASVSPDAMIIASAYLYTALILRGMMMDKWSHRDTALAIFSAATICMTKPVYAPLFFLGFVQILSTRHRVFTLMTQGGILLATGVLTLVWGMCAAKAIIPVPEGVSVDGQIDHILGDLLHYAMTLARSLLWHEFYYTQLVGMLGWLSFELPTFAYLLPIFAVILATGGEKNGVSHQTFFIAATLLIIGTCVLLILTALYISWTPVAAIAIKGVQGRYFLPLLPLALMTTLLACRGHAWWRRSVVHAGMLGLIAIESSIVLYTVSKEFLVFG